MSETFTTETSTPTPASLRVARRSERERIERDLADVAAGPLGAVDQGAQALADELSTQLGETVKPLDPAWRRYAQQGIIVDLHVKRERFKLQLTLRNLGIEAESDTERKAIERILAPGHLYLLPIDETKRADSLDGKLRDNLTRYGYKTFWGKWIPVQAYPTWKAEHEALSAQYKAIGKSFAERYDELSKAALIGWIGVCNQAYERLRVTGAAQRIPGFADRDTWIRGQIDEFGRKLPSAERIVDSFEVNHDAWLIPTEAMIQQDQVRAGNIRLDAAEQVVISDLQRTAAARIESGVNGFLDGLRGQLQAEVFDVVTAALKVMRGRGGKLQRNSSVALAKMIESTRMLRVWGPEDGEATLDARLDELERLLATSSKTRDNAELQRVLQTLGAEARLTLLDLGQPIEREAAERADAVGISDDADELAALIRRSGAQSPSDLFGADDDDDDLTPAPAVRRGSADQADQALFDDDAADEMPAAQARVAAGV